MDMKNIINTELIPAIIQDAKTRQVLMLGYMNEEALQLTETKGRVTFYSRSRQKLWTKGETSGNYLDVVDIKNDCDNDTLLITVNPQGPTCHTGTDTCWGVENKSTGYTLDILEKTVLERQASKSDKSYTAQLLEEGINKVAQKVGEEAVELVIEAKDDNKELFLGETADLLYHVTVLLAAKGYRLSEIMDVLEERAKK